VNGRFRLGRAVVGAAAWGIGVVVGVALGGWLTVVGGAGTPGVEALDFMEDLVVLPGLAGATVFLFHLIGQYVVFVVRRRRASGESDEGDQDDEHAEDQGVGG